MLVASDDATAGSVIANADRISPASSGASQSCFCSAVPNRCSVSMFPVSGAWQLIASGAITGDHPVTSATAAYSRFDRPDSAGRNRFHRPRSRASALRVSITGGRSCSAGVPRRASRQASYSASAGRIDSSRKARMRLVYSSAAALGAKSTLRTLPPAGGVREVSRDGLGSRSGVP